MIIFYVAIASLIVILGGFGIVFLLIAFCFSSVLNVSFLEGIKIAKEELKEMFNTFN